MQKQIIYIYIYHFLSKNAYWGHLGGVFILVLKYVNHPQSISYSSGKNKSQRNFVSTLVALTLND